MKGKHNTAYSDILSEVEVSGYSVEEGILPPLDDLVHQFMARRPVRHLAVLAAVSTIGTFGTLLQLFLGEGTSTVPTNTFHLLSNGWNFHPKFFSDVMPHELIVYVDTSAMVPIGHSLGGAFLHVQLGRA